MNPAPSLVESLPPSVTSRRPKSLILDVYGRYAAQFQGWLPVSDLVELMGLLRVDEQAVRSAVSRMTRRGLLEREARDGVRGYAVTAVAQEMFAEADRKIYEQIETSPVSDGWVLAAFSMPEEARNKRHALRSQLMWLGMGTVSSGLRIGPSRILAEVIDVVQRLDTEDYVDVFVADHRGLGDTGDLINRAWDLSELASAYQAFVDCFAPVLDATNARRGQIEPMEAFATYTLTLHQWRKFPYLDPGLAPELLPPDWPGAQAWDLFNELRCTLEPLAFEHASRIASRNPRG